MENVESGQKEGRKRVKKSLTQQEAFKEYGKIPPQALDIEAVVLGSMMLGKDAFTAVYEKLHPEVFYKEAHKEIFKAIKQLFETNQAIDILTVTTQLKKNGKLDEVGGAFYISQLTARIASSANIEFHASILIQKHLQRELIRISTQTVTDAFEDSMDVFDLLDAAERNLFEISQSNIRKGTQQMPDIMRAALLQIDTARKKEGAFTGVPTGFTALDRITGGWQPSDLIVVAARPGMGKTAFVLSMARNMAIDFKKAVAVFSLEMTSTQLVTRLISGEAEISADKLRKGDLQDHEWQQLLSKTDLLSKAPLYIDDTPSLSVFELRARCRRLKSQFDIQCVIIDYIQLMTVGGENKIGNREQEISTISRSLKALAKELDVPVIALSQLNRSVETRPGNNKKPMLSDLRESGAIEQDADLVGFIYRPEYYQILEDELGNSTEGKAMIIIAKHRNGATDDVWLAFRRQFARFENLESTAFGDFSNSDNLIQPNKDFEQGESFITVSSKMNTDDYDPNLPGDPSF